MSDAQMFQKEHRFLWAIKETVHGTTTSAIIDGLIACQRNDGKVLETKSISIGTKCHHFEVTPRDVNMPCPYVKLSVTKRNGLSRLQIEDNVSQQKTTPNIAKAAFQHFKDRFDSNRFHFMDSLWLCFESVFWKGFDAAIYPSASNSGTPKGDLTYSSYIRTCLSSRDTIYEHVFALKLRRTGSGFDLLSEIVIPLSESDHQDLLQQSRDRKDHDGS